MVVTLLCLVYMLGLVTAKGGPLALVTLGTRYSESNPRGSEGYDGQFVYMIARDPSTAAPFLDVPAYRFQRILLPALAIPLSFGQTALIPWALAAINLLALAAGTALVEKLLRRYGASRWLALGYGLALGTLGAARLSLPEPLAYALALGGVMLALDERPLTSAILFALAALAKETTLIVAAGCGLWWLSKRQWRDALVFGIVVLAPFAVWEAVLYARLGAFGVGSGGAQATRFELIPFGGVIRIVTEGGLPVLQARGVGAFVAFLAIFALIDGLFVLLPTVWGLLQVWRDWRKHTAALSTWLLLTTSAAMLFVPFSTYREPLGILRLIVGLQIAVILQAARTKNRRALLYSTVWALTTLLVVFSDF